MKLDWPNLFLDQKCMFYFCMRPNASVYLLVSINTVSYFQLFENMRDSAINGGSPECTQ